MSEISIRILPKPKQPRLLISSSPAIAKSIFLANVSHELRTPLNGVIGNSEILRDSELTKDQAEMADSIRVSAGLLHTVINDILDFSKMEADKMELFVVAFKADEMMREVVRSVSYSNRDKKNVRNVEILQDINFPQSLIFGDPVRLHQVLGNLVSNSLKFTENGSITIGARTDWETSDQVKLTFWVKDTGIGILPQQLVKLFKPFGQADASTARKYGGSGLGLSICKSLIESMMGGKIQLESVGGEGTTAWFTATFPKAKEATVGDIQNSIDQPYSMPKHTKDERARSTLHSSTLARPYFYPRTLRYKLKHGKNLQGLDEENGKEISVSLCGMLNLADIEGGGGRVEKMRVSCITYTM